MKIHRDMRALHMLAAHVGVSYQVLSGLARGNMGLTQADFTRLVKSFQLCVCVCAACTSGLL